MNAAGREWAEFDIPASSGAVGLRMLHQDPDGGLCLLVRFPAGWERPGPGSYDVPEEVLFLAGELEMGGVRYRAGDYAWLPAHGQRSVTRTDCGALAVAWFSGPNRWTPGQPTLPADGSTLHLTWTGAEVARTPFEGLEGRLLRREAGNGAWVLERVPVGIMVPESVRHAQLVDLSDLTSLIVEPGDELPSMPVGPVWLRTAEDQSGR